MFTGIINEVGRVVEVSSLGGGIRIVVKAPRTSPQLGVSDSVSVNGVCQTVVEKSQDLFAAVAVEETLTKTTLGHLRLQAPVNLELPLQLGDRLGGHMVLGHVDCVGSIQSIQRIHTSTLFEITFPLPFKRYIIPVGSVAIDGVSLTVASLGSDTITVSIIPYTLENTIFSEYVHGSEVNLEFDVIGKYVERLLATNNEKGESLAISLDQLKAWGYNV